MAATLTARYIDAVTRSLTPATQDDVRVELEASIADAIEARLEQGEMPDAAERGVITELGDPAALAASYADRPLQLIGPRYYLTWWRLLKLLLIIVPLCAVGGVTIANLIADRPVGEIVGEVFTVGIATIVHVAFWTTLVFAILERIGADTGVVWSPDSLPEPQTSGAGRADLIGTLIFLGLAAAALLWDRFVGFVLVANGDVDVSAGLGGQTTAMSVLNPDLWPWWLSAALVLIAAEAALAIVVFANRGWRRSFAVLNTLLAVVFVSGALYLLTTGQLMNPQFLEFTLGRADVPSDVGHILAVLTGFAMVGIAAGDIVDGWLKTRRASRAR